MANLLLNVLFSGLVSALVVAWIAQHYSHRRFCVENFERLRQELQGDRLHATKEKIWLSRGNPDTVTEAELRNYLEFLELVGVYWKRKLIDRTLLSEIVAEYVLDMYEYPRTMIFVLSERKRCENDEYYLNFEALSKWCGRREEKEKALTRRRREKRATARRVQSLT